jgi:hypothetical protein
MREKEREGVMLIERGARLVEMEEEDGDGY